MEHDYSKRLFTKSWYINEKPLLLSRNDGLSFPAVYRKLLNSQSQISSGLIFFSVSCNVFCCIANSEKLFLWVIPLPYFPGYKSIREISRPKFLGLKTRISSYTRRISQPSFFWTNGISRFTVLLQVFSSKELLNIVLSKSNSLDGEEDDWL